MLTPTAAAFLLLVLSAPFDGYQLESVPTGKLYWKGWSTADRERMAALLPRALDEVEVRLGRKLDRPFIAVLAPDGFELRRLVEGLSGSHWRPPVPESVLGIALPEAGVLILRGGYSTAGGFDTTLLHEVAHLVIHRLPERRIPRWFDEGVAQWVSRASLSSGDESYMSFLARIGAIYPLGSLNRSLPEAYEPTTIAYQESLLLVHFLAERHGDEVVPRLLDGFETGAATAAVFQGVLGEAPEKVEESFRSWLVARRSLPSALVSILNIWTISALVALVAIVRFSIRSRRRLARMDEEEETEDEEGGKASTGT